MSKRPRSELAHLIAAQVCTHATMAGMRMAAPLMALKAGYSAVAVGFLLALFALTQVVISLPAGRFVDRHGLKKPLALAVAVASSGCALAVVVARFEVLCLAALMTGGAVGLVSITLQRHVGRAAADPTELKRVFSWLSMGPAFSNFIGPLSAGLLIDHAGVWLGGSAADSNGFRGAFLAMALLPLLTWWWVRNVPELPPVATVRAHNASAWDLLALPMMKRMLIVNWLLSSCWDVHTFLVPLMGHDRGLSASVIGTILGLFAIAATAVRSLLPLVAAHLREGKVLATAMVSTAVLFGIYPLLTSAASMALVSVFLGVALGCVQPMIMSTLHQITPQHRQGEALGIRLMTINASSVVMPLLFGTAGAVAGVSVVFWLVGSVVGLGAGVAWQLRPPNH